MSRLAAALLCSFLLIPTRALAFERSLGRGQVSRPLYVGGGLGLSLPLNSGSTLFKLQEHVGYQFDPIRVTGNLDMLLRLGGDAAQQLNDGTTLLQFGVRVSTAFGVWRNRDVGVWITPSLALGGAAFIVYTCDRFSFTCRDLTTGAFNVQFAVQGELELMEGSLFVWFRPLVLDAFAGPLGSVRWDFLLGLDVHF